MRTSHLSTVVSKLFFSEKFPKLKGLTNFFIFVWVSIPISKFEKVREKSSYSWLRFSEDTKVGHSFITNINFVFTPPPPQFSNRCLGITKIPRIRFWLGILVARVPGLLDLIPDSWEEYYNYSLESESTACYGKVAPTWRKRERECIHPSLVSVQSQSLWNLAW